jgi:hypothetical protein
MRNTKTFRSKRNRRTRRPKQTMYLQNGGVGNVDTTNKDIFIFRSDKISLQQNTDPKYKEVGVIHLTESGAVNAARALATGIFNIVGAQGFDNPVYDNARNYALQKLNGLLQDNQKVCNLRMEVTNEETVFFVHLYGTLLEKTDSNQEQHPQQQQVAGQVHEGTATPQPPLKPVPM